MCLYLPIYWKVVSLVKPHMCLIIVVVIGLFTLSQRACQALHYITYFLRESFILIIAEVVCDGECDKGDLGRVRPCDETG